MLTLFAPACMLTSGAISTSIAVKDAGIDAALADHGWLALQLWNLGTQLALVGLSLYLLPQFLMRKRRVPKLMIIYLSSSFVLGIVNTVISAVNDPALAKNANPMWPVIFRVGVIALWIRYFQSSDRVKETFIRD
jgi:hypothetical protein